MSIYVYSGSRIHKVQWGVDNARVLTLNARDTADGGITAEKIEEEKRAILLRKPALSESPY
jgi:hypothetical protein